jgi:serine/threonine protein kinase
MQFIGKIIADHYQIQKCIGKGSTSEVYLAIDFAYKNRPVAIKILNKQLLSTDIEGIIRFKNEIIAASKLDHPNIAAVYEILEIDDYIYIIMEHIDGQSLYDIIDGRLKSVPYDLNVEATISILIQICSVLDVAHNAGIIHRALNPSAIMLSCLNTYKPSVGKECVEADFSVKLLGFGHSRFRNFESLEEMFKSEKAGSELRDSLLKIFFYTSPEQLYSKKNQ